LPKFIYLDNSLELMPSEHLSRYNHSYDVTELAVELRRVVTLIDRLLLSSVSRVSTQNLQ